MSESGFWFGFGLIIGAFAALVSLGATFILSLLFIRVLVDREYKRSKHDKTG